MKRPTAFEEVERAIGDIKEYPVDSIGNTLLTLLADKIKLSSSNKKKRTAYLNAIRQFAFMREKISLRKICKLCNLIWLAELRKEEYCTMFAINFQKHNWGVLTRCNIAKRAEIFRLLGESKYKFFREIIPNESEIKEHYPWHWIDAVIHTDQKLAITEIKKWLKNNQDAGPILPRLGLWKSLYKDKKSFQAMVSEITEGIKLSKCQERFIKIFFEL